MAKRTIEDLHDLKGKRILIRVDFNVPVDSEGKVTNDRRIRSAVPTLRRILEAKGKAIVMSHLGRPKGDPKKDTAFKMDDVARHLSKLLHVPVRKLDEVVGPSVEAAIAAMKDGEVLLLENLRFHPGEQSGDRQFAQDLARLGDVYVNDAFGTCHRRDASMVAVPEAMHSKPRVVGLLVAKELEVLDDLLSSPKRPFAAILGGAKVSDKIGFIKSLLGRVDRILIGGAMAYTFMKAQGQGVGSSKAEDDKIDVARELLQLAAGKMMLPEDHVVVRSLDEPGTTKVAEGVIPDGWIAIDVGPKTISRYQEEIAHAGTIIWNGPLGKYEEPAYARGTRAIAEALAASKAVTVIGGGETAEAVEEIGLAEEMTHVSSGGGAFLEYVEGTPFPALAQIEDKKS
jgi:phosphoglycerate kinase